MNLTDWMRENFDTVRGMNVEDARKMAQKAIGNNVSTEQIGQAFTTIDFERRGMKIDEGWKHARREDLPREEELRRERNKKRRKENRA